MLCAYVPGASSDSRRNSGRLGSERDRKSTRLNSSHLVISYAVFCLKKKSTRLNSSHLVISYAVFCLKKKNGYIVSITLTYEHAELVGERLLEDYAFPTELCPADDM